MDDTAPMTLSDGISGMDATFSRDPSLEEFQRMQDAAAVDGISPGMQATFTQDPSLPEFQSLPGTATVEGISQDTPGMQAIFTQDPSLGEFQSLPGTAQVDDIPPMEAISLKVNLPGQSQGASTDGGE